MRSTPGSLTVWRSKFLSSNPTQLQAPAMRTEPRSPSLPDVCIPRTIAYGIPYRTRRSIRNSEIAYGIFAKWFCCGNPRSKIAYGIPIDEYNRDTESIRKLLSRYGFHMELAIPSQNHCGKQSGRLPEPNLPSFLGDTLPFLNTKKSDEANAKPPHFRLIAANGQPMHPLGQIWPHPCCHDPPPSAKQSHTIACTEKPPTTRQ